MGIDLKDVENIAVLARLSLHETEKDLLLSQLKNVLDYVEKLSELDTTGVPPTSHVIEFGNVMREDHSAPSLPPEEALSNAPSKADNFYRVPKIIE